MSCEHGGPVVHWNDGIPCLTSNQLRDVDLRRCVDYLNKVVQAANNCASKSLLEKSEAPIGGKLRMPDNEK